jgi:ribonuclease R
LKKPPKGPRGPRPLPSREELLAFIGTHKGKAGVREIARAFGLKNNDRAALKTTLRELGDEGKVERRRKKLHHPGALPAVVLADVTERDADGELIAVPTEWDSRRARRGAAHPPAMCRARRAPPKSPASATAC